MKPIVPTVSLPRLPHTRTEYLTTDGVRWTPSLSLLTADAEPVASLRSALPRDYRPGRTYHERFNHPVFGPALHRRNSPGRGETPRRSTLAFQCSPTPPATSATRWSSTRPPGCTWATSWSAKRRPAPPATSPISPREPGTYRLTTEATRPELFAVSTAASAEWTFMSSQVDGPDLRPIELNVVRFLPKLDANGKAPAGRPYLLPLRLQDGTGAIIRPRRLTVEVSYDDGSAWRRASVSPDLVARLDHPAGASSVSLRVSATDQDGNTVKQTVIRVYLLS